MRFKLRTILITTLVFVLLPCLSVQARTYRFTDLQIEARLGADGAIQITETHTVEFDGKYEGLYQWIDTSGGIEVRDVVVTENGIPYKREERDSPGPAGTYYVRTRRNEVYVDWSFEARDETRIFQLQYTLDNAVLKHNDVAELYYKFVGDRWEKPRDNVRIVLYLPYGAERDEVLAWGHGPRHGEVSIISGNELAWEVSPLPSETFVEGRVVFPKKLVPLAKRVTNRDGLASILAEEEGKIQRQERREKLKDADWYTALLALGLLYLLNVYLWHNYAKPYPGIKDKYFKQLPATYPPAELGVLYRKPVSSKTFMATILDLARRDYMTIKEIEIVQGKRRKAKTTYEFASNAEKEAQWAALASYERLLLSFVFEAGEAGKTTLEELTKYIRKNRKKFADFWKKWIKEIKEESKKHDFFDERVNKKAYWILVPVILIFLAASIFFVAGMLFTGGACILMGLVTSVLVALAAERRTPEGNMQYTKWRAFQRYLKDFSRLDISRIGSLGIWEEYLPYAFILGVADQVLKQLEVAFPNLTEGEYRLGGNWFIYHHAWTTSSFSNMTKSIDNSISTSAPATAGGGGGFSGGGGGGFGGGGGGAR